MSTYSNQSLRVSLYFSKRRDRDIIEYVKNIEKGEINWEFKKMIREYIKLKTGGYNMNVIPTNNFSELDNHDSNISFDDIHLERKELSENEILNKLENLL